MSASSKERIALPKRNFNPGEETSNTRALGRIHKACHLEMVKTVRDLLGRDFSKIEQSFLAPIVHMALDEKFGFSRHLLNHFLQRRILTANDETEELWFAFGEQPMRFALREFVLATGLPPNGEVVEKGSEKKEKKTRKKKAKGRKKGKNKKGKNKKDEEAEEEEVEEEEGLDAWMKKEDGYTLKELVNFMEKDNQWKQRKKKKSKEKELSADSRVRIGALIIVESTLLAKGRTRKTQKKN